MADIELVIKMPEEMYKWANDANKFFNDYGTSDFIDLIKNSKPLPEGHGRLVDADEVIKTMICYMLDKDKTHTAKYVMSTAKAMVKMAPTIVEADITDEDSTS